MPTDYKPKHDGVYPFDRGPGARARVLIASALGTDNAAGKWFDEQYVGWHSHDFAVEVYRDGFRQRGGVFRNIDPNIAC